MHPTPQHPPPTHGRIQDDDVPHDKAVEELPDGGEVELSRRLRRRRARARSQVSEVLPDGGRNDLMELQAAGVAPREEALHRVPIRPAGVAVLNLPAEELGPCKAGRVHGALDDRRCVPMARR